LKELYNKWNESGRVFEVVLVSGDSDQNGFDSTMSGHPFLAIPFEEKGRIPSINSRVPCTGYPTPGFLNAKSGAVLNADAFDETWNSSLLEKYLAMC
jgi:hypothetical protein